LRIFYKPFYLRRIWQSVQKAFFEKAAAKQEEKNALPRINQAQSAFFLLFSIFFDSLRTFKGKEIFFTLLFKTPKTQDIVFFY